MGGLGFKVGPNCCCTGVVESCCDDSTNPIPSELLLDIAGVTGGDACAGQDCSNLYTDSETPISLSVSGCIWRTTRLTTDPCTESFPGVCADTNYSVEAKIIKDLASGDYILRVEQVSSASNTTVTWEYNFGTTKPDCNAFDTAITLTLISVVSDDDCCDFSGATATIEKGP